MFIDFLTLMLVNLVASLFVLAAFVYKGLEDTDKSSWVPVFTISGLIAFSTGLYTVFTWPLPGSYNIAFGETSVLFGALLLGAALTLAGGWSLRPLALYAFFAGIVAIVIGVRIFNLGLTKEPLLSAASFIGTGLAGVGALPLLYLKNNKEVRMIAASVLVIVGLLWVVTTFPAVWNHLASFAKWLPVGMRKAG